MCLHPVKVYCLLVLTEDVLSSSASVAGYPLELHCVTTADGYILQMERIPRPGCARVAWFQHGILDTSLTWVSSGVTGSQAFAAWDQGFDVWLGSSRSNPPRQARGVCDLGCMCTWIIGPRCALCWLLFMVLPTWDW